MDPIRLQVVIPFHAPLSATADDLESAYSSCYEPLVGALDRKSVV